MLPGQNVECDTFDLQKVCIIVLLIFIIGGAEHTGAGRGQRWLLGRGVVLDLIDHAADPQTWTLPNQNAPLLSLTSGCGRALSTGGGASGSFISAGFLSLHLQELLQETAIVHKLIR